MFLSKTREGCESLWLMRSFLIQETEILTVDKSKHEALVQYIPQNDVNRLRKLYIDINVKFYIRKIIFYS